MAKAIDWGNRIGRRVRLRDLHILFAVIQFGSMAKAASNLGVSQPAISEAISDLEHSLGVRLLDRTRRGVIPTIYAEIFVRRGRAAFDELKQGIEEIEFLTDPAGGEVRIGCSESIAAGILPPAIERYRRKFPGVVLHVQQVVTAAAMPVLDLRELRERRLDLVLARVTTPFLDHPPDDDLKVELLFDDPMVIAVGAQHRLARRRKIDLAELANEPWILPPPDSLNHMVVEEAFQARGLAMPKVVLVTLSLHLRDQLLTTEPLVTAYARSNLRHEARRLSLKVLPVQLPVRPWVVAIVSLKNRTLSPAAQRLFEYLRAVAKSIDADSR